MKRIVSLILIAILITCLSLLLYTDLNVVFADINNENILEINKEYKVKDFVNKVTNGELQNGEETIVFDTLGNNYISAILKNELGNEKIEQINVKIIDTESPTIMGVKDLVVARGSNQNLTKNITIKDNSNEEIIPKVLGEYNFDIIGEYKLKYYATDSSGNEVIADFKLIVEEKNPIKSTYYVKINKTLNVIMVYVKDKNNNYTKLVKTFVASAGKNTPVGTFNILSRTEALAFAGGKYGHYATRITGPFWFHSVPYYSKGVNGNWSNLMYKEYNKLGEHASAGCIRLSTIDAKWIYENIPNGTQVEIYESDTLPSGVVKPTPIKINVNSENRGWDPTDPNEENPWHEK